MWNVMTKYFVMCVKAYKEKKLSASCLGPTFISAGCANWKDAPVNFANHEKVNVM